MLGRLLLAAAAGHASNRGHEVAQFVRARAGLLKSIVLFRTHVDDALTVRIYKTLHASLNNAKNYDLSILYDPDALATCCAQFDEDAASIKFGLQEFETSYPHVELMVHKLSGQPGLKKSHYQQLAYAYALRGKDYEYAWCIEHDVALTGGNWLGLFEAHAADRRGRADGVEARAVAGASVGCRNTPRRTAAAPGTRACSRARASTAWNAEGGGGPSARATAVLRRSRSCSGPSCATRRGLRRCWIRTRRPTRPPTVIVKRQCRRCAT
jgi:hypothetical protein